MTLSTFLLCLFPACFSGVSGSESDSIPTPSVLSIDIYSENQWASNAATKWAVAGFAFGGDISTQAQGLNSRTRERGSGIGGGSIRQGVSLVLPSANIGKTPDKGRWNTLVALEHFQVATASWTPGMAHLFFGSQGLEDEGRGMLGPSRYKRVSLTSLKVGGVRTHRTQSGEVPLDMTLNWSVNVGELHSNNSGYVNAFSEFTWDADSIMLDVRAGQRDMVGTGTVLGFDFGVSIAEADGGHGRRDRWSFAVRDLGTSRSRDVIYQYVDTSAAYDGVPLLNNGFNGVTDLVEADTLQTMTSLTIMDKLPSTISFRWEREALKTPGVSWGLLLENNSAAPRPRAELMRSSGRGAVRTTLGIGYGGWGGTYIPFNLDFPSRDVRQGEAGGTLALHTRWLALPGSGGRMGLGVNWHQTF